MANVLSIFDDSWHLVLYFAVFFLGLILIIYRRIFSVPTGYFSIAPGAKIFGPVIIGDASIIGANAVVHKSFPETGHVIVGNPAVSVAKRGSGDLIPDFLMSSTLLFQRKF
jgi:hypothetical protein